MKRSVLITVVMVMAGKLASQHFLPPNDSIRKNIFDKKILWGFTYTQSWSTLRGSNLAAPYFSKVSVGLLVSAEYYPLKFLGFSLGVGYQQRGAGIKNSTVYPLGTVDSTYRDRLRFNTFEFPIAVILRTPKDVIKGLRFSGALGIVPIINRSSRDVKISLEPNVANLDKVKDVSSNYFKNDVAIQFAAGPEIDMAGSQVIKIQFYYSMGTTNVYTTGQGTGHNQNAGIRLAWMF